MVAQENVRKRLADGTVNGLTGVKTPPAAGGRATGEDLYGELQDPAQGASPTSCTSPMRTPTATPMSGSRRQRARHRRHRHHRPLSQYRLRQWRQHQGHDRRDDVYLRLANDKTKIVPGHGPLADKAC